MIYEKLSKIQAELKAPKSQHNGFGKYNYRSSEDILEALKPILLKEKCVLKLSDEIQVIGNRYYVKASAILVDAEDKEETGTIAYAREEESKKGMDGSQVTGASSSYARKYALNGLFAIDDNKDSDYTNNGTVPNSPPNAIPKGEEQKKAPIENKEKTVVPDDKARTNNIAKLIKGTSIKPDMVAETIKDMWGKKKANDLTDEEYLMLIDMINTQINNEREQA